jgi:hypothetical protein
VKTAHYAVTHKVARSETGQSIAGRAHFWERFSDDEPSIEAFLASL